MARGSSQATGAATSAQNLSNTLGSEAQGLYSSVAPELQAEAAAPSGYNPHDLAAMNTAAQQAAGGSMAGATGQGALLAARTRNAGAPAAAIGASARGAQQTLGKEAVGVQEANANLKERQRQAGLTGEENLYGRTLGGATTALGEVAPAVNANTNAASQSYDWARYLLSPILNSESKIASAALGGG